MHENAPIQLTGSMDDTRDFTYVADVVKGILAAIDLPPSPGSHKVGVCDFV